MHAYTRLCEKVMLMSKEKMLICKDLLSKDSLQDYLQSSPVLVLVFLNLLSCFVITYTNNCISIVIPLPFLLRKINWSNLLMVIVRTLFLAVAIKE